MQSNLLSGPCATAVLPRLWDISSCIALSLAHTLRARYSFPEVASAPAKNTTPGILAGGVLMSIAAVTKTEKLALMPEKG